MHVGQLQNKKTKAIFGIILWLWSMLLSLKLLPSPATSCMRKRQGNLEDYRITKSEGGLGDGGKNKQTRMSGSAKKAPGTNVFFYYCMLSGFARRIAWNFLRNRFEMSLITTKWYFANFEKADNYWTFPWAFGGVGFWRDLGLGFFSV